LFRSISFYLVGNEKFYLDLGATSTSWGMLLIDLQYLSIQMMTVKNHILMN